MTRYVQRHEAILRRCRAYIGPGADVADGGYVFHRVRGDANVAPYNVLIVENDDGTWSIAIQTAAGVSDASADTYPTAGRAIRAADYGLTCGTLAPLDARPV